MIRRVAVFSVIALALAGCDTMIADRMIIRTVASQTSAAASASDVLATTKVAFGDCGLAEADITDFHDAVHWRSPKRPPGLHVMIHPADEGFRVTLAQDLYGPIGPTDAYRCVKKSLRRR